MCAQFAAGCGAERETMKRFVSALLLVLLAIEFIVFLLPTLFIYFLGVVFFILPQIFESISSLNTAIQASLFNAFMLLSGYGLYCLLWLLGSHRRIRLDEVSKFTWGGLAAGVLSAIGFSLFNIVTLRSEHVPGVVLIFGFGPVLLTLTLLASMKIRERLLRAH